MLLCVTCAAILRAAAFCRRIRCRIWRVALDQGNHIGVSEPFHREVVALELDLYLTSNVGREIDIVRTILFGGTHIGDGVFSLRRPAEEETMTTDASSGLIFPIKLGCGTCTACIMGINVEFHAS